MGKIILNGKEYVTSTTRGFPPLIYSDEEREVGVWRDGKPLYQKTFNGSFASDQTSLNINWGITGIQVLHIWGFLIPSDTPNNRVIIGNNYDESSLVIFKGVGGTGTTIGRGNVAYFGSTPTAYVTILYTKTTDIAGSGKYSAVGDLMHHYSTTEQVVGTWIDGSTLYEKTKVIPVSSTSVINNIREIPFLETGQVLKRIVYAFANDATYGDISLGTQTYVSNSNMSNNWGFCRWYGGLAIYTTNTNYWSNLSDITVIYQYTKSSS